MKRMAKSGGEVFNQLSKNNGGVDPVSESMVMLTESKRFCRRCRRRKSRWLRRKTYYFGGQPGQMGGRSVADLVKGGGHPLVMFVTLNGDFTKISFLPSLGDKAAGGSICLIDLA